LLRRGFFAALAAGAVTAPAVLSQSRKNFNWRLVLAVPKTLPVWGPGVKEMLEQIELMSEGQLKIRMYGAGELVPALQAFGAVKSGRVEMAHAASYYWQGMMPSSAYFTCAPFGLDANGMRAWLQADGQVLWDELYAPHGVFSLPCGNTGMQMGGWFNKEINRIEDFRGLKMRIPGIASAVIQKAGGQPMLVPGGEIYTNLSTGVLDATEWVGPYHDYILGLHQAAKFYYYPGWQEPGPVLELIINRQAWQTLPPHLQAVVRAAAAAADLKIHATWMAQDAIYLEKIAALETVQIKPFPPEVLTKLKSLAEEVTQDIAKTSPLAEKIYHSHQTFLASYQRLQKVTAWAYNNSFQQD